MGGGSPKDRQLVQFTMTRVLSDPELRRRVGLLLLMSISTVVGWWSASTWIPEYAAQVSTNPGHQPQLASSLVGLMFSAGSIGGYLLFGVSADIFGRQRTTWF